VFKAILDISQDPLKTRGDTLKKLTGNVNLKRRFFAQRERVRAPSSS
jgi:hypothetical protein